MELGTEGNRRTGNHGISANNSSHADSNWLLKELTEGTVKIGVGSLGPTRTPLKDGLSSLVALAK